MRQLLPVCDLTRSTVPRVPRHGNLVMLVEEPRPACPPEWARTAFTAQRTPADSNTAAARIGQCPFVHSEASEECARQVDHGELGATDSDPEPPVFAQSPTRVELQLGMRQDGAAGLQVSMENRGVVANAETGHHLQSKSALRQRAGPFRSGSRLGASDEVVSSARAPSSRAAGPFDWPMVFAAAVERHRGRSRDSTLTIPNDGSSLRCESVSFGNDDAPLSVLSSSSRW